jgi:hypothetical protein
LSRAEFSSDQSRTTGYSYSTVAPSVRLDAFQFSSLTDF